MTPAENQNQDSLNDLLFICTYKLNQSIPVVRDLDFHLVKKLVNKWHLFMTEFGKSIGEALKGGGGGGLSLPSMPKF
jgi:hypothetical protein